MKSSEEILKRYSINNNKLKKYKKDSKAFYENEFIDWLLED